MNIVALAFLGFFAFAGLLVYLSISSWKKSTAKIKEAAMARGWTWTELKSALGAWEITGHSSGLTWRLACEPDEDDSDHDWHTVLTADLPFPDYARVEVMPRMAWSALRSPLMESIMHGALQGLAQSLTKSDAVASVISLEEVVGVGDPEFTDFYAVAGDAKAARHLMIPDVVSLMMGVPKPLRPTLSIHGQKLILKSSSNPIPPEVALALGDVGALLLRQAGSGQRLSA